MSVLNHVAETQLRNSGFNDEKVMQRIKNHALLVEQINEFAAKGGVFEKIDSKHNERGASFRRNQAYEQNQSNMGIGVITFAPPDYADFTTLAHELGHALGKRQARTFSTYVSAHDYAHAVNIGEAEAIFNEYKILKWEWDRNVSKPNVPLSKYSPYISGDMFATIDNIMSQTGVSQEKKEQEVYDCLANYNKYAVPNSFTSDKREEQLSYYQKGVQSYL